MAITIKLPEDGSSIGTRVFNGDTEIQHVTSIDVKIRSGHLATATLEVGVMRGNNLDNVHALLGTETLEQIAELHGYELKRPCSNNANLQTIGVEIDCSNVEPMSKIIDLIAEYKEDLPDSMVKQIEELL